MLNKTNFWCFYKRRRWRTKAIIGLKKTIRNSLFINRGRLVIFVTNRAEIERIKHYRLQIIKRRQKYVRKRPTLIIIIVRFRRFWWITIFKKHRFCQTSLIRGKLTEYPN